MAFFILTRFVLVKYSRAFVERPLQGTSSLAAQLTTVSLDSSSVKIYVINKYFFLHYVSAIWMIHNVDVYICDLQALHYLQQCIRV